MKSIKYVLLSFLAFFVFCSNIYANSLDSIDMDVTIDTFGNLHVTEVWKMNTNKDSEIYKEQDNLGNMGFINFKVKDEHREYSTISPWDINASFDDKKYKAGINYTSKGLELCWGISEYGSKFYTLNYTITNAVFNTSDAQVLYIRLINDLSFPPNRFQITITGPNYFDDKLDVWGYGYEGYAYVNNGKIYMSNKENTPLAEGDYGVLLVKFPLNTFNVSFTNSYSEYQTFDDVLNRAEENSFDYDNSGKTFLIYLVGIVFGIFLKFFPSFKKSKSNNKYKFGKAGKSISKDINNFRDIPCDKNIFRAYFLSQVYGLNKKEGDFIGSVFLKWLNENAISIVKVHENKLFGKGKEVNAISINEKTSFETPSEEKLYNMIVEASKDGILNEKEMKKWAERNYYEFYNWFKIAETDGRNYYINEKLVIKQGNKYLMSDDLKPVAIELAGLKKYLIEFSKIHEKQPIEVKLWKEYLMFAQIFGIADEVAEQFKKLYPEVLTEMADTNYDIGDIIILNHFYNSAISSASSARSAASSYSGGGGGFSSGGGGGGSFGGGGGGSR